MIEVRKDGERIKIAFPYNPNYITKIKSIEGYQWHPEKKYWSLPYSELKGLLALFDEEKLNIDPSVWLDELKKELVARKYSSRTIKAYLHYNEDFLTFSRKDPHKVENDDVKDYLFHLAEEKEVSTSTLNTAINALKFYYGEVIKKRFVYEIKRPKKDKKLPVVLSQEEVSQILSSVSNIKHKAILMLIYSSGLRVSEVVKLKPEDIDTERKLIHVKEAKGRKDRYTILSDTAMETLNEYLKEYTPQRGLFPGAKPGKHINTRTVEKIFTAACKKAEIRKEVSVHSLRHSFATHLIFESIKSEEWRKLIIGFIIGLVIFLKFLPMHQNYIEFHPEFLEQEKLV